MILDLEIGIIFSPSSDVFNNIKYRMLMHVYEIYFFLISQMDNLLIIENVSV